MVAQTPRKFVPWEKVLKEVADFYNIKPEEIQGISQTILQQCMVGKKSKKK